MFRTLVITALAAGVVVISGEARQTPSLAELKTTPEATSYKATSSYDDVVRFMKAVDAASPQVFYVTYGKTYEGRDMPMAVVGAGLKDGSPASVLASNRMRVHIQGNIHAGEVEGKEAALVLLRELAQGQHADWLRSMVFLITPIFNADGNEKFALTNRGSQNGPINGMGVRSQGQGLNINRDFMKLETPEGRAFVKLWNDYDPQMGFDLHTSDGSYHGYYLTYAPPLNPATNDAIMANMKNEWFPFVTKQMKSKRGWDTFYYGNTGGGPGAGAGRGGAAAGGPPGAAAAGAARAGAAGAGGAAGGGAAGAGGAARGGAAGTGTAGAGAAGTGAGAGAAAAGGQRGGGRGTPRVCAPPETPTPVGAHSAVATPPASPEPTRAWNSFEALPRYHNSYVGMRNRFALLSEAYAYATFEDRIKATNYFMEESLNFAMQNADRLKKIAADADKESIVGKELSTRSAIKVEGTVEILMGEVEDELNPNNGACMNRRKDVAQGRGHAQRHVVRADRDRDRRCRILRARRRREGAGIAPRPRRPDAPAHAAGQGRGTLRHRVEQPAAGRQQPGRRHARSAHAHRRLGSRAGRDGPGRQFAIAMNQKLARLAFYLLAPTSDDGLVTWNALDEMLGADVKEYPVLRKK